MVKKKTHSGASKRFKKLKSGLIKASHPGKRHLLTKKSRKRKKALGKAFILKKCDQVRLTEVL